MDVFLLNSDNQISERSINSVNLTIVFSKYKKSEAFSSENKIYRFFKLFRSSSL
jgi:hypothetical protein